MSIIFLLMKFITTNHALHKWYQYQSWQNLFSVTLLQDTYSTCVTVYSFLNDEHMCSLCLIFLSTLLLQDLQTVVQQQRADMDSARDALSALCRSHPSPELSRLSSDLTSIAKRTEAVAQRCAKARGNLQDGLQLHFNGNRYYWYFWLDFDSWN